MPRSLSAEFRRALFAPETGECVVCLVQLDHPDLGAPIRVCSDAVDVFSGGNTYLAFPFRITLADDSADAPPRARLQIDNVDRRVIDSLRSVAGDAMTCTVSFVLASNPSQVEMGPLEFALRNVQADALVVEGDLVYEEILSEPYPSEAFDPIRYPAIGA